MATITWGANVQPYYSTKQERVRQELHDDGAPWPWINAFGGAVELARQSWPAEKESRAKGPGWRAKEKAAEAQRGFEREQAEYIEGHKRQVAAEREREELFRMSAKQLDGVEHAAREELASLCRKLAGLVPTSPEDVAEVRRIESSVRQARETIVTALAVREKRGI